MRRLKIISTVLFIACLLTTTQALAKTKAKTKAKAKPAAAATKAVQREIPETVIKALASGDLSSAVLSLREEPTSPKVNYLLHEATAIVLSQMGEKPAHSEEHKYFQNLGIAYHNIFLFLKAHGIETGDYFDQAVKNYKKARGTGTVLHKSECDLLTATIYASNGEREKAGKIFKKIDDFMLRADFESTEYLAAYYAAMGDAAKASEEIRAAFDINPSATLSWLEVGDDFHDIESDAAYKELLSSLSEEIKEKDLTLSVPDTVEPALKMDTQKPAIAVKKKAKPAKKTKAVSKKTTKQK